MNGQMSTEAEWCMESGGRKNRNKKMRWDVSPWVNLCCVLEGWIDGLMDGRLGRHRHVKERQGGGLIACDLIVNIALLRWQHKMRDGSVLEDTRAADLWHLTSGSCPCVEQLGDCGFDDQPAEERAAQVQLWVRKRWISRPERPVKDYRATQHKGE